MPKSINEKYLDATENALYDNRFEPVDFAINMAHQPIVTQMRFFRIIAHYIDAMAGYVEQGFVPMGMRDIGYACGEMQEVLNEYFPIDADAKNVHSGVEWEQI